MALTTPKDEFCTAKAVRYRKVLSTPIITTQCGPENGAGHTTDTSTRDPELRKYDTVYPDIGLRDGRATYLSYRQRGYDMNIAQRVVDWEHRYPRMGDELAATDRYFARNARPWERQPIEAPAVLQHWHQPLLSPTPCSLMLPPRSPLPRSPYIREHSYKRPLMRKLRQLNLRSPTGSPSFSPTCEVLDDHFIAQKGKKTEMQGTETSLHPPVSYLTEGMLQDRLARKETRAGRLQDRRQKYEAEERKRKEQEKSQQEMNVTTGKERLVEVSAHIKDLARSWRERYPGPDKLFRTDFDFGPKTQGNDDKDYRRPLSPRSSNHSLSYSFADTRNKSLKRQRHDSSNNDVVREPLHDRYHAMSSPIPMQRSQPTTPTSKPFPNHVGSAEAHPSQLVESTSPETEIERSGQDRDVLITSKNNHGDAADFFKARENTHIQNVAGQLAPLRSQMIGRDSCCEKDLRDHLVSVFNKQGKLKDNTQDAQAAVDEAVRVKKCKLQRKPRTTRDRPPLLLEPISGTRTGESQVTEWSQIKYSQDTVHTLTRPLTAEYEGLKRKGSYVARCRSTEMFLRDVRASQARRQLARNMECEGRQTEDMPDPRRPEQSLDDWLGEGPL